MRNIALALVFVSFLVGCTPTGSPTAVSNDPSITTKKYSTVNDKVQLTAEAKNATAIEASMSYNGKTFTQVAKSGESIEFPNVPNGTYEIVLTPRRDGVKGSSETLQVLVGEPGANPSPSASATPIGYSFQAVVTGTNRDMVTWRLDGAGYRSASLSYAGSLVSTNRGGTLSLSGLPSGGSDVVARVTLDDGSIRTENVRVDLSYSGVPSPAPSSSPPVVENVNATPSDRGVVIRVNGSNATAVTVRLDGKSFAATIGQDLTLTGFNPNTSYSGTVEASNSAGTTSRTFSFITTGDGGSSGNLATGSLRSGSQRVSGTLLDNRYSLSWVDSGYAPEPLGLRVNGPLVGDSPCLITTNGRSNQGIGASYANVSFDTTFTAVCNGVRVVENASVRIRP